MARPDRARQVLVLGEWQDRHRGGDASFTDDHGAVVEGASRVEDAVEQVARDTGVDADRLACPRVEGDLALEGDECALLALGHRRARSRHLVRDVTAARADHRPQERVVADADDAPPEFGLEDDRQDDHDEARERFEDELELGELEPAGDAHQSAEDHEESDQDPADETASPGRAQERQHDVRAHRQHEDLEDRLGVEVHGSVVTGALGPMIAIGGPPTHGLPGLPLGAEPLLHGSAGSAAGCSDRWRRRVRPAPRAPRWPLRWPGRRGPPPA